MSVVRVSFVVVESCDCRRGAAAVAARVESGASLVASEGSMLSVSFLDNSGEADPVVAVDALCSSRTSSSGLACARVVAFFPSF